MTWPELGYFALIELMAGGLYCGISFVFFALILAAASAAGGLGP